MSIFNEPGTTWYFSSDEHEPFSEIPLRECTSDQIQAKVEFLEKNILLLRCECEVIELNSIKVEPELAALNTFDVSWMPYNNLNAKKNLLSEVVRIAKLPREKVRQSVIFTKSNKSVFSSIYSVVNSVIKVNKISIHQVIAEVEKALVIMNEYFNKINNQMIKKLEKIENKIDNTKLEISRQLQFIEIYRTNVLIGGIDRLTKRISADTYEKYIKKKLMSSTIYLNNIQFKMTDAIIEEQKLHKRYLTSKHNRETVFESDMHNVMMMNKKLSNEQTELLEKNQELKQHLRTIRQDYLKKKYYVEKFELSLDLPSLEAEIRRYRNKLLKLTPKQLPAMEENRDNYKKEIDDDNDDDKDGRNQIKTISSEILDERINHYLEVKRSIEKTERYIKSAKLKLNRQIRLIQIPDSKLKNV